MIYNQNIHQDVVNLLQHIQNFSVGVGVADVQVDTKALQRVCVEMREKFPHVDGLEKASVFKKVANFVAHFLGRKPIRSAFPIRINGHLQVDFNAVIALDVAIICLQNSTVLRSDAHLKVSEPIFISDHSYADIIEALSDEDICPKTHYMLLAVFFEQLTYKTNRHVEYDPKPSRDGYYAVPFPASGGDDLSGV